MLNVDRWDVRRNKSAVYDALVRVQQRQGRAVGLTDIAREAELSRTTALKHLKWLVAAEFVQVKLIDWRPGIQANRWSVPESVIKTVRENRQRYLL